MFLRHLRSTNRMRAGIRIVHVVSVIATAGDASVGGALLFDDFDKPPASGGSLSISDEDERSNFKALLQPNVTDISVRTQLRVTQGSAGALLRWNARQPAPNGYFGLIRADGMARLGWAGGNWPVLREVPTGLDPAQNDVLFQLDAVGNQVKLWTWPVGQLMPKEPTLSIADDAVASGLGSVALGGMAMDFPDRGPIDGVFRYVLVTDTLVPEPSMAALAALASAAMTLSHRRAALRGFT
jgi:hypothetical protein